jgi:hypothetical protein
MSATASDAFAKVWGALWGDLLARFIAMFILAWPIEWSWNATVAAHGHAPAIGYWEALAGYFLATTLVRIVRGK